MGSREPVDIDDCEVIVATSAALLIRFNGIIDKKTKQPLEAWIPKSQIHDNSEVFDDGANDKGTLTIPEWLAEDKDLI